MTLLKLRGTQYSETLEVGSIMIPGLAKSMDSCIYILCLGALERMTAPETDLRELNEATFCVSPLFKVWIAKSPKMFKQILVDLFMITRNNH